MSPEPMLRTWWRHVLLGVPLSALLHSIVQFAYDRSTTAGDLAYLLLHIALGTVVGSVILTPAYTAQAVLFHRLALRGTPRATVILACGALQAGLVGIWALTVGIQPSLGGRFAMDPVMIAAGFVAGAVVAAAVSRRPG